MKPSGGALSVKLRAESWHCCPTSTGWPSIWPRRALPPNQPECFEGPALTRHARGEPSLLVEVVVVQSLDLNGRFLRCADVMFDHESYKLSAVNEDNLHLDAIDV